MNSNQFSSIFVDPTSTIVTKYDINKNAFAMSGIGNSGNICQDIFIENKGSNCLGNGGYTEECYGACCYFSDTKCVEDQKNANKLVSSRETTTFNDNNAEVDEDEGTNIIKDAFVGNTTALLNETLFNSTL